MVKQILLVGLLCIVLAPPFGLAEDLCPTGVASAKLICLGPQVYGVNGLELENVQVSTGSAFQASYLNDSLTPLNSAIARQAALLPLASPSSGITFSWDAAAKVFAATTDSFGPVLGERAETIGKYRLFLGFGYQYFAFDSLDGVSLKQLPVVFPQADDNTSVSDGAGGFRTCSVNGDNTGDCGFIRDVISTNNRLDLKIHQFTTFVTFGLTNRIDVSMAVPIENIRMSMRSDATIIDNSLQQKHSFALNVPTCGAIFPAFVPCQSQSFSDTRSISGIGDITLRVKGTAWKGEHASVGLGVDVRVPTGDELNFLGAGAAGVRPFFIWSYRARVSPHAQVGYEVNGSSKIVGDVSTGKKERLPGQLTYTVGADVWLTKRLTAAFDLVGQQVFEAQRTAVTNFPELGRCKDSTCTDFDTPHIDPTLSSATGTYNISNASIGVKFKPYGNLLVTGNVLIRLTDGGLKAKPVPLIGVSYTF